MAAMKAYSISVPTKQGDETTTTTTRHIVGESQHQHEQDDAFSRYSNNFVRMKSLLLSSEEEGDDLDALATINQALRSAGVSNLSQLNRDKRRRGNNSRCIKQGTERKTRISWELHPTLLLHELFEELEVLDDGTHRILDDEDEEEASGNKPQSQSPEEKSKV
ncbi:hypothetical protein QTG54_013859 [Skeletonema marinoi]|uniref:Uncharacterized protein n=1 Tax=Skeletonema marinoi TaxID=267567 RepID=A0AAD8XXA3_9STRA|nr:hypothetical protein QTG54_013859 [Skeletonema marinoi]